MTYIKRPQFNLIICWHCWNSSYTHTQKKNNIIAIMPVKWSAKSLKAFIYSSYHVTTTNEKFFVGKMSKTFHFAFSWNWIINERHSALLSPHSFRRHSLSWWVWMCEEENGINYWKWATWKMKKKKLYSSLYMNVLTFFLPFCFALLFYFMYECV